MTDTARLNDAIKKKGLKKGYLAERIGLTRQGFSNCLNNRAEFKASQIQTLCEELGITDAKEKEAIFFGRSGA